ncbi:FAD-binding oxidoreductase [Halobacillus sp. Nhm2S1]|uniref:FAD-binding oxidoreductase n=1 Tax=Halobacillus sp. Nhm2S1 TaxID=2866716 RepID=UPI001C734DEF|nr:FAD-binding oxidoreductase [Halobacillus sp. Nhm2S1]MBX0358176.1 FAD-binding oxidoreductase [Halobacillus sp. Nhm2S1]
MTKLKEKIEGEVLIPSDDRYEETRKIFNAAITKRPSVIVVCKNAQDVSEAVKYATKNDLEVAVRGGGHHVSGTSLTEGGLLIDLSQMTTVEVHKESQTVSVQGGATLADIDEETQKYGLAMPTGTVSETGIAGLALSGGVGYLRGVLGLSCDQMVEANIVTASGEQKVVSKDTNDDLFWAIRGGGGNFGVVTEFKFNLHFVGPEVLAFDVMYDLEDGMQVFRGLNEYLMTAPDEVSVNMTVMDLPPAPMLPEFLHNKSVMVIAGMYAGNTDEGQDIINPLRKFAEPIIDQTGVIPYTDLQKKLDPMVPQGASFKGTSLFFKDLNEDTFAQLLEEKDKAPGGLLFQLWEMHGQVNAVPSDFNAFSVRDSKYLLLLDLVYEPGNDEAANEWADKFYETFAPFSLNGAAYLNGIDPYKGVIEKTYGSNYQRLQEIKAKYDPHNVFARNHNIKANQKV